MKITKSTLKKLIKEELDAMLAQEAGYPGHKKGVEVGGPGVYAKRMMSAFKDLGWSIYNAKALWAASGEGTATAEELADRAAAGEEVGLERLGPPLDRQS